MSDVIEVPIHHGPKRSGRYVAGPGRPKGTKRGKYVTVASILKEIEDASGSSYQEQLAALLHDAQTRYYTELDMETYPKLMMHLGNKLIEQARQMPEDTSSELDEMSDEELLEKRKEAVLAYIKEYGIPND